MVKMYASSILHTTLQVTQTPSQSDSSVSSNEVANPTGKQYSSAHSGIHVCRCSLPNDGADLAVQVKSALSTAQHTYSLLTASSNACKPPVCSKVHCHNARQQCAGQNHEDHSDLSCATNVQRDNAEAYPACSSVCCSRDAT